MHMAESTSNLSPLRLGQVEGYLGKKNEIVYHAPKGVEVVGCVIFFGGDIQDYRENMLKHRDNKHHLEWNLENTCSLLHNHFPDHVILIIKPSKMTLITFSCYENFAEVNNFGVPTFTDNSDSLKHLYHLLNNAQCMINELLKKSNSQLTVKLNEIPYKIIGFSKGCIVLNQFLYSFLNLKHNPDTEVSSMVSKISDMYWLDGGHSGTSETWITNMSVLENFASMGKMIHIHLTPFQICSERPSIEPEEKKFRKTLIRLGCKVNRELHFADEPRSLENHFKVLEVFKTT